MPQEQRLTTRYEAVGASDRGRTRTANEDSFRLNLEEDGERGNFVVCDGMGGAAAGEVASRVAAEAMLRAMSADSLTAEQLQQAVAQTNARVHSMAERDPALAGMGTTLVALAARGLRAWVAHVGDSRCYRFRRGRLEPLTADHSLVDEQVRLGQLTPAQAAVSPMRNVITRAVGTEGKVAADVKEIEVAPGDLFLLASDGLTRELDDEQIEQILRGSGDLESLSAKLIEAANEAGGSDNVTCLLVRAR
jgi:PPM family protein phosphatase